MRLILAIILIMGMVSCTSSKPNLPTLSDMNPVTGMPYTSAEIREINEDQLAVQEEENLLDRLLSAPILLMFAAGGILLILTAVFFGYQGNIKAAICAAIGAGLCVGLPVLIIMFFKAMKIVLYILGATMVICAGMFVYWIYRKLQKSTKANEILVENVNDLKPFADGEKLKETFKKQDPDTKHIINKIKN